MLEDVRCSKQRRLLRIHAKEELDGFAGCREGVRQMLYVAQNENGCPEGKRLLRNHPTNVDRFVGFKKASDIVSFSERERLFRSHAKRKRQKVGCLRGTLKARSGAHCPEVRALDLICRPYD
jgi:hypothetical protein